MSSVIRKLTVEEIVLIAGSGPTEPDSTFVPPSWPPVFQPTPTTPAFYLPD
jgi:hypothetical protein